MLGVYSDTYGSFMATDTLTLTVASNVSELFEASGETLSSLSRATGLTRSKLRDSMYGKRPWKTTELAVVAEHYNTTPDALCTPKVAVA